MRGRFCHSLTHSLTRSTVIQCVTAGKAVRAPFNFSGFPRAKHNFLDRLLPNIPLLEILTMGYFKSRVEHLCDLNKKNNGGWSSYPLYLENVSFNFKLGF